MGGWPGPWPAHLQGALLTLHVVRWADAPDVPWRNGGGMTRELVVQGDAPFHWRLSAATIAADGPFSEFPGIDRILVLLRGCGVRLRVDDSRTVVLDHAGAAVEFAGEQSVAAHLIDGATVDLNLMWRRDLYTASLQHDLAATGADLTVVHALDGEVTVAPVAVEAMGSGESVVLHAGDTAWWAGDAHRTVPGPSRAVRFHLRRIAARALGG